MPKPVRKHESDVDLERRQITVSAALALLGGATITLGGCGSGGGPSAPSGVPATPPPATTPPATAADLSGTVCDPEHTVVITAAQLAAGNALLLEVQWSAGLGHSPKHTHAVELSAEHVRAIARGERVFVYSSTNFSHYHTVAFEGVPPASDAAADICDPSHAAQITGAQLAAGGALDLDIRGGSDHSHIVTLDSAEVVAIRGGGRVQKFSTTTFQHGHQVTFN